MNKISIGLVVLVIATSIIGCSLSKTASIEIGNYILKTVNEEIVPPKIVISEDTFTFTYDSLSSYMNVGTYSIEKNMLTLTTDDGRYHYTFKIHDNTLVFESENSSSVEPIDERMGLEIKDGDIFQLEK